MKPTPSPDQAAAINAEVAGNNAQTAALLDSVPLQDPIIEQKQKVDDAFKDLFAYYNDKIIGPYDAERKIIDGSFVVAPVLEADILGVGSNPPSGRLVPVYPALDILRIPEFDGTAYTGQEATYEIMRLPPQAEVEDVLVNGYGAGTYPVTLLTSTAVTPSSTTLSLEDLTTPISGIVIGTVFILTAMGDLAVVKVTGVTTPPGTPPPYELDLDIELIVPPTGTIAIGTELEAFEGFLNSERTTKTSTVEPDLQPLMDYLIDQLELKINDRISTLNLYAPVLALNEDPDGVADIATAQSNVDDSLDFLTNYLITTDISDVGLASLAAERATRSGQLTARLAQIIAAYTGQTENYYEQRYQTANNRGNVQRGTLRAVENAKNVKTTLQSMAAGLAGANVALNSILP